MTPPPTITTVQTLINLQNRFKQKQRQLINDLVRFNQIHFCKHKYTLDLTVILMYNYKGWSWTILMPETLSVILVCFELI